jgi:hypothetical protein
MAQRTTILILVGALLVIGVISYSLIHTVSQGPAAPAPANSTSQTGAGFDLTVLQRSDYKALDQAPIQNNQLPAQPPSSVGKANPFL